MLVLRGGKSWRLSTHAGGLKSFLNSCGYIGAIDVICRSKHLSRQGIHCRFYGDFRAVNVFIAENAAEAVTRIRELMREREKRQTEFERLRDEFKRLEGQIADMGSEKLRDASPDERQEQQA